MPGKIGIRIPSHNSLTPAFLDELLKFAATSRKNADAHKIRRRLHEKCHIAIVSTGLSYLAYLGALRKSGKNYRPSRLGKRIGKLLAQDRLEEANLAWNEMLRRHKLYGVFRRFLSNTKDGIGTIDSFGLYLRKLTHAKWQVSGIRSRISRLCELFSEKNLIEYQNGHLSLINEELSLPRKDGRGLPNSFSQSDFLVDAAVVSGKQSDRTPGSASKRLWPVKIEIKFEISEEADPNVIAMILSFLRDFQGTTRAPSVPEGEEVLKDDLGLKAKAPNGSFPSS